MAGLKDWAKKQAIEHHLINCIVCLGEKRTIPILLDKCEDKENPNNVLCTGCVDLTPLQLDSVSRKCYLYISAYSYNIIQIH